MKINLIERFIGFVWSMMIFFPIWTLPVFRFSPKEVLTLVLINMVVLGGVGTIISNIYFYTKRKAAKVR